MTHSLKTRAAAVVLCAAAFMPWYSSQAIVERDVYLGNPLPLIDWVALAAAVAVLVRPRLAMIAGVIGLVDVTLGALLMSGDSAEGLRVSLEPGLPLALAASVALLVFRPKTDQPNEVTVDTQTDEPSSVR